MTAAFRGNKKFGMGNYTRKPEEEKAALWCIANDICITLKVVVNGMMRVITAY